MNMVAPARRRPSGDKATACDNFYCSAVTSTFGGFISMLDSYGFGLNSPESKLLTYGNINFRHFMTSKWSDMFRGGVLIAPRAAIITPLGAAA